MAKHPARRFSAWDFAFAAAAAPASAIGLFILITAVFYIVDPRLALHRNDVEIGLLAAGLAFCIGAVYAALVGGATLLGVTVILEPAGAPRWAYLVAGPVLVLGSSALAGLTFEGTGSGGLFVLTPWLFIWFLKVPWAFAGPLSLICLTMGASLGGFLYERATRP